jgi:putative endonuclease
LIASPRKRGSICHYVYILASKKNGTLYIGVTTDLKKRVWQHKEKIIAGFIRKYKINTLVYYEIYDDYWDAANREKRMKKWNRDWKIELIRKENPDWLDLYDKL